MGQLKKKMKSSKVLKRNVVNLEDIAGTLSKEDKEKLMTGSGFVKVPTEELKRLRIDAYPYLLQIMEIFHYPYHFVQRIDEICPVNTFLRYKLLYAFKSPKSHQWYWVWVEVYMRDFYAVKFHLKAHRNSPNKYNLMTGLNEARPVINTCIAIMQEIGHINPRASFGFIGANMQDESDVNTKRFRVYRRLMATYFTEQSFEHYFNIKKSSYLLICKSELEAHPDLLSELDANFKELYPYFD